MRVGVVTGLAREADLLTVFEAAARPACAIAAADPARAAEAARRLAADGCAGLVSFGVAGGLDPALAPGALVLASAVVAPDGPALPTDTAWRGRLAAALGSRVASEAPLAGADAPLTSPAAKAALRERTGCAAVDMESHGVAAAAAAIGLPFLVVRAVADPAARALPAWLAGVIGADGRPRIGAVAVGLLRHPGDAGALAGLASETRRAFASLRRVAALGGPVFRLLA